MAPLQLLVLLALVVVGLDYAGMISLGLFPKPETVDEDADDNDDADDENPPPPTPPRDNSAPGGGAPGGAPGGDVVPRGSDPPPGGDVVPRGRDPPPGGNVVPRGRDPPPPPPRDNNAPKGNAPGGNVTGCGPNTPDKYNCATEACCRQFAVSKNMDMRKDTKTTDVPFGCVAWIDSRGSVDRIMYMGSGGKQYDPYEQADDGSVVARVHVSKPDGSCDTSKWGWTSRVKRIIAAQMNKKRGIKYSGTWDKKHKLRLRIHHGIGTLDRGYVIVDPPDGVFLDGKKEGNESWLRYAGSTTPEAAGSCLGVGIRKRAVALMSEFGELLKNSGHRAVDWTVLREDSEDTPLRFGDTMHIIHAEGFKFMLDNCGHQVVIFDGETAGGKMDRGDSSSRWQCISVDNKNSKQPIKAGDAFYLKNMWRHEHRWMKLENINELKLTTENPFQSNDKSKFTFSWDPKEDS